MTISKRKRNGWAIAVSIGGHGALLLAAIRLSGPEDKKLSAPVQLEITSTSSPKDTSRPTLGSDSLKTVSSTENAPIVKSRRATVQHRRKSRFSFAEKTSANTAAASVSPTPSEMPDTPAPNDESAAPSHSPAQTPGLRTTLQFSDYEKFAGDDAVRHRERLARQSLEKRRSQNALAPKSKELTAALQNRRSVLIGANVLPAGNKISLINAYLQEIHKKLAPRFSSFLNTLDSPSERMHKKVQNSPLKYNPFYVPPPETERQRSLHGPMNDLSTRATAEFEILPSGGLAEVRLVKSSTYTLFDSAAIDAVLQSAPFAPPPPALLSRNNRSYLRWTFSRDWKKNTWAQGHLYLVGPNEDTETSTE